MKIELSRSPSLPWIAISVYAIFQPIILMTWAPLEKGELNVFLTSIGVVTLPKPYADFRTISEGIPYYEQGGDPYGSSDYDFIARKFNYPPIWLKLSFLGVEESELRYIYITFGSLFSIGLGLLFLREKNPLWFLTIPFILSPPILLGLERCNNDLLVFFLVVLAVWFVRDQSKKNMDWIGGLLILVATVLKVFPVFAFWVFIRNSWKRSMIVLLPFACVCLGYYLSIKSILDLIRENTPVSAFLSFGIKVLPYYLSLKFSDSLLAQGPWLLAVAFFSVVLIFLVGYRLGKEGEDLENFESYDTALFRVGSGIHLAAFLLGSNYDYRLMFLLLTLPWACRKLSEVGPIRKWMIFYLPLVLFVFWMNGQYGETVLVLNELANWSIFFVLVALQFKLLPQFVRDIVYR